MKKALWLFCIWWLGQGIEAQPMLLTPTKNSLTADKLFYRDNNKILVASSNVILEHEKTQILADHLSWDISQNSVTSTGNITLKQGPLILKAEALTASLNSQYYRLQAVTITSSIENSSANIKVHMDTLEQDAPSNNIGTHAIFTTCDLVPPHYVFSFKKMTYVPEDHLEGAHIFFKNRYINPLFLWTPYYRYALGKRRINWNIPTVGKKETKGWGWFVQNTIDYDSVDDRDSNILLDWFEFKGIGWGVQHQVKWQNHSGTLSYYQLREQDTQILNEKIGIQDHIQWQNKEVTINLQHINAERLTGVGRQNQDTQAFSLNEQYPNQNTQWNIKNNYSQNQQIQSLSANVTNLKNGTRDYSISVFQNNNQTLGRNDILATVFHSLPLTQNYQLDSQFNYSQQALSQKLPDNTLKSDVQLKNKWKDIATTLRITTLTNLDGDRSSRDIQLNRYFYRLPELQVIYTPTTSFGTWTHMFTVARYQESYITAQKVLRVYPNPQHFTLLPNTYIYGQNFSISTGNAKQGGLWSLSTTYSQYIFDTTGTDLFSGDALYSIGGTATYSTDSLGFFQTSSQYKRLFSPPENNSPFYEFTDQIQAQNSLAEKWTFYIQTPDKYAWSHETGYDWEAKRWQDYKSVALARPLPDTKFTLSTGKKLNPTAFDTSGSLLPTTLTSEWTPPSAFARFGYTLSLDTNAWVHQSLTKVQQSNAIIAFPFGDKDPLFQWTLAMSFAYDVLNYPQTFSFSAYQLQTLELTKYDHCQTFSFSYNKLNERVAFKYTINAFPEDPLELIKTSSSIQLGGRLQSNSQERF